MKRAEWHIGSPDVVSTEIEIDPLFFVSFTGNNGVMINDELRILEYPQFVATRAAVRACGRETLPDSGVYALTLAQLRDARAMAEQIVMDEQSAMDADLRDDRDAKTHPWMN